MLDESEKNMLIQAINLRLGILLGLGFSGFAVALYFLFNPRLTSGHDSLFVGMVATVLSVVASSIAYFQARIVRELAEDGRNRKKLATRARLPGALDDITGYAHSSVEYLDYVSQLSRAAALSRDAGDMPEIPTDAVAIVQNCIEFSDQTIAYRLADLLDHLQVQRSRMKSTSSGSASQRRPYLSPQNMDQYIADSVWIYCFTYALFAYSRRESEEFGQVNIELIDTAIHLCSVDEGRHEDVRECLHRYLRRFRS